MNIIQRWLRNLLTVAQPANLFTDYYVDGRKLFYSRFGSIPNMHVITRLDGEKVLRFLLDRWRNHIVKVCSRQYHDWEKQQLSAGDTILVFRQELVIDVDSDRVFIYSAESSEALVTEMYKCILQYPESEVSGEYRINIIVNGNHGLDLRSLPIEPTELDIDLYYNDDFKPVDKTVKACLSEPKGKGIVLLHGLPGTGKTTYLRHLIGSLSKKVLFLSPTMAGDLARPELMELLLDHPDSVLVIEDAENILMDRKITYSNTVSNLLNISDGLLNDCLNIQLVCTFNNSIQLLDQAFLRKGRLIAQYAFGKLETTKAQRLSDHLGLHQRITAPLTLAEITNPGTTTTTQRMEVIGFRREVSNN
ncbi:AAA family ATPase [Flavihumibacter petaseus]|uniref:AAA+ ATPase domain-containing protein n=1 Tax=Flavihumibacter petaseus NBRC 106054 TaxID=1220578 RepID=A0A0E9MXP1_9BACT|nr:AAA family ATPase [Flavihumibacter petaseus]GAO42482.1 hypothetical protein FPE01S_01_14960 [Flavihumibacter petaseus NBRC 106054]